MIARFKILLPYSFSVREGDELIPHEFTHGEYRVRIHPPFKAAVDPADTEALSPVPMLEVLDRLQPADVQESSNLIQMDNNPTIQANLLQIDFLQDEFDRRRQPMDGLTPDQWVTHGDPSIQLAFELANGFLTRIRTLTRGSQIKPVSYENTYWRLDYLMDDEEIPPFIPELFRRRYGNPIQFRANGLNSDIWTKAQMLPADFMPPTWDRLLLDAEDLLPEVGPAIVLAYSALETFIESSLDQLVSLGNVTPGLWDWIRDRARHDWRLAPSVNEQFDDLLQVLTTRSLKEDNQLWEALQNLREARNKFTHEGRATIGGSEVTLEIARRLIGRAKAIINWVEVLLPENARRPKLERNITYSFLKQITAPPPTAAEEG